MPRTFSLYFIISKEIMNKYRKNYLHFAVFFANYDILAPFSPYSL